MPKAAGDAKLLIQSLTKAYATTPTNLKIINLYVVFAVATALVQDKYECVVKANGNLEKQVLSLVLLYW